MTTRKNNKKNNPAKKKKVKKKPRKYSYKDAGISVVNDISEEYIARSSGTGRFIEDTRQTKALKKAAQQSAEMAIKESKALGLTITYMEDGVLYEESPSGKKRAIKTTLRKAKNAIAGIKLKKGMILRVRH